MGREKKCKDYFWGWREEGWEGRREGGKQKAGIRGVGQGDCGKDKHTKNELPIVISTSESICMTWTSVDGKILPVLLTG